MSASIEARLRELYNELHALRETVMVLRAEVIATQRRVQALEVAAQQSNSRVKDSDDSQSLS